MSSFIRQCQFEAARTFRNRQFLVFSLAMPLIFYFIFLKVNGANYQLAGTTWKTYFLMSMAAFSVVGSGMFGLASRISHERTQGWLRLVQTTPMRHGAYVLSKCFAQCAVGLLSVVVLFVVSALSQHVHLTVGQWIGSALWLSIGSLPFITLGLLIGVVFSVEATMIICNILNMALGVLGGLWFPVTIMPKLMQDIVHWTPTYRFAHVAWQGIAGQGVPLTDVLVLLGYIAVFAALVLWALRRQEEHDA